MINIPTKYNKNVHYENMPMENMRGGSNEYPQSMFWSKTNKIRYTPANPSFTIKVGFKKVYFSWTRFPDDRQEENVARPASRTWLVSHVASAGLEPTPDTVVR